jgi:hypothetical protein
MTIEIPHQAGMCRSREARCNLPVSQSHVMLLRICGRAPATAELWKTTVSDLRTAAEWSLLPAAAQKNHDNGASLDIPLHTHDRRRPQLPP